MKNSEMFAQYGYTIFLAQKFEKYIASLLQGEFALENKGKIPYDQYHQEITGFYKGNLGGLLKKLKKRMIVDTDIEELLQKALTRRNYLIHDYFYHNESKVTVADGRLSIIQELIRDQDTLSKAIEWVAQRCKENLQKIGIDEATFAKIIEKNIQEEVGKFRRGESIDFLPK